MTVWYKDGVVGDLQPVAQKGLGRIDRANPEPKTFVLSTRDRTHMSGSFHYIGMAFDLEPIRIWLKIDYLNVLGPGWQVIVKKKYVHCEYDPNDS